MRNSPSINLNEIETGKRIKVCSINPTGSLIARKDLAGLVKFHWRCVVNKKDELIEIGFWNPKAPTTSVNPTDEGYSIRAAVRRCEAFAHQNLKALGDTNQTLKQIQKQKIQADAKLKQEQKEKEKQANNTLGLLLDTYLLTISNPTTRRVIANLFSKIPQALRDKQANSVRKNDIHELIKKRLKVSTPTTTNNLIKYMSACFNLAMETTYGSEAKNKMQIFKIFLNPCRKIKFEGVRRTNKNPLLQADLIKYAKILSQDTTLNGARLRIHLYTGGLRPAQLCRLKKEKVDFENNLFVLVEKKGKEEREYATPIPDFLKKDFEFLIENTTGDYLFSADDGFSIFSHSYLTERAKEKVEGKISNFTLKRIRSGHTTLMGDLDIPSNIKNHLQSHGNDVVVDGSYDGYAYLRQKLAALNAIYDRLNPSNQPPEHLKIVEKKSA